MHTYMPCEGAQGNSNQDDPDKEELKAAIVLSLSRRVTRLSASLQYAVATGDVEEVSVCLSFCLSVCLRVCPLIFLSVSLYGCLSYLSGSLGFLYFGAFFRT